MAKMGQNAANEGQGGMDPEATGTAQGDISGEGDDPGGLPGPRAQQDNEFKPPSAPTVPYISPALQFSAAPQQGDIQNNFSTSQQYAQRYGLANRTHF